MYSHGSSARIGVGGKRGHGGRNYRPPPKRRDPNTTPPPLKECSTLLQFQIPEYQTPAPQGRIHQSFGGGGGQKRIQKLEKEIRSQCLCHLVVPGRKQGGPVAIVGRTIQEALPAAAFLLNHLQVPNTTRTSAAAGQDDEDYYNYYIEGQIQSNVKNLQDAAIVGRWCIRRHRVDEAQQQQQQQNDDVNDNNGEEFTSIFMMGFGPNWLFQSTKWNVMVCPIRIDGQENNSDTDLSTTTSTVEPSQPTIPTNEDNNIMDDTNKASPLPPLISTSKVVSIMSYLE